MARDNEENQRSRAKALLLSTTRDTLRPECKGVRRCQPGPLQHAPDQLAYLLQAAHAVRPLAMSQPLLFVVARDCITRSLGKHSTIAGHASTICSRSGLARQRKGLFGSIRHRVGCIISCTVDVMPPVVPEAGRGEGPKYNTGYNKPPKQLVGENDLSSLRLLRAQQVKQKKKPCSLVSSRATARYDFFCANNFTLGTSSGHISGVWLWSRRSPRLSDFPAPAASYFSLPPAQPRGKYYRCIIG